MTITLENVGEHPVKPAYTELHASGSFPAVADDRLVIGIRRGSQNILHVDEIVPVGKQWDVYVTVKVMETET